MKDVVERWKRKSKIAELGVHILVENTRKSIIRKNVINKKEK